MMEATGSELAKSIISLRDRELSRQSSFRSLWQSTSEMVFPQTYAITGTITPGTELMLELFDNTAVEEAENMASGITNNLFPPGERFFGLTTYGTRFEEDRQVNNYLEYATQAVHQHIANSNFQCQVGNTIHYWVVFGTGALYTDWDASLGLNYRDYAIGTYQCCENYHGIIDTIIMTCPMTARQIVQKFGEKSGPTVIEAYRQPERQNESFNVIHVIRPRENYDHNPRLRPASRMPWESLFVQEQDSIILEAPGGPAGFEEFPFAIPRYYVIYREVYGRGRGTTMLRAVRVLNRVAKDYLEMSNKWVNPPREILETFEGTVDATPGAANFVTEIPSTRALDMGANGAYPVTKDLLEYHREGIREGFFKRTFETLGTLKGDRRTTTEIVERLKEGMKRLNRPLARLFTELLEPVIWRSTMLLIRNQVIDPPPKPIEADIEFINPLALALKDQQSRGLQYWAMVLAEMEGAWPGITDNMNADEAARDLGRALGVKQNHIRPIPERDKIRQQRAAAQAAEKEAMMAMGAAESYGKATKKPEPGSLAEAAIGGG